MLARVETSALLSAHREQIYRYLLSMVHNPSEAEDLTQETLLRAHSHRDSLRDPNSLRGWLYRIATRTCLDHLRRRVVQGSIDDEQGSEPAHSIPSTSPSALEIVEREETGACVQRCLDFLSDDYRAVILLYEVHSLTAPEIAKLLGESVGTVKIRLHRARRKLQGIMQLGCAVSQNTKGVPCCEPKRAEDIAEKDARALLKH